MHIAHDLDLPLLRHSEHPLRRDRDLSLSLPFVQKMELNRFERGHLHGQAPFESVQFRLSSTQKLG